MAVPAGITTAYPAIAKDAAWQKKKSFMDKAKKSTKTGLGAALIAAEKAYAKIDFDLLDAKMAGPKPTGKWRSEDQIRQGKVRAQGILATDVKPAIRALETAASKARVTSQNAALSTTAKTAAAAISAALLKQSAGLHSIQLDDFDAEADRFTELLKIAGASFRKKVLELEKKLGELERTPTKAEWTRLDMKNAFRSLGNNLGNNPIYADLWPIWKPWDGLQDTRGKLQLNPTLEVQREEITKIIRQVRPELAKVKLRLPA